jgi:hypothetical protein
VEVSGNNPMTLSEQIAAEELARAARLRRMAGDLTNEARAIEAKYRVQRPALKKGSLQQIFKEKGLW